MTWLPHIEQFKEQLEYEGRDRDTTFSCTFQKQQGEQYLFTIFSCKGTEHYLVFENPMRTMQFQLIGVM